MRRSGHTRYVLLLRMDDGTYFVCDEYYPSDNGRIHVLGRDGPFYASYHVADRSVEYKKASFDVAAQVYQGEDWPTPIAGSKDRDRIIEHFSQQW